MPCLDSSCMDLNIALKCKYTSNHLFMEFLHKQFYSWINSGTIHLPVFMGWISTLSWSDLAIAWADVVGASLVLESSTGWPRRTQWSGSSRNTKVLYWTRHPILELNEFNLFYLTQFCRMLLVSLKPHLNLLSPSLTFSEWFCYSPFFGSCS